MGVNLIIERMSDWSYGAFLNETDATCIAVGFTEEDARANGELWLQHRADSRRNRKIHELKSWPQFFEKVVDGSKTFEVRLNDRDFKVGDFLFLREWNPETKQYSGRFQYVRVTYIFGSEERNVVCPIALHPDYVILAIMLTWSTQTPVLPGNEKVSPTRPEPLCEFSHGAALAQTPAAAGAESTAGLTDSLRCYKCGSPNVTGGGGIYAYHCADHGTYYDSR